MLGLSLGQDLQKECAGIWYLLGGNNFIHKKAISLIDFTTKRTTFSSYIKIQFNKDISASLVFSNSYVWELMAGEGRPESLGEQLQAS